MNDRKSNLNNVFVYFLAWGILPLAYLSWCLMTIGYQKALFSYAAIAVAAVATIVLTILMVKAGDMNIVGRKEVQGLAAGLAVTDVLLCIAAPSEFSGRIMPWVCAVLVINLVSMIYIIIRLGFDIFAGSVKDYIMGHIGILAVAGLAAVLAVDSGAFGFKWDGLLYYDAVKLASLESVSSVALYGHVAMGSGTVYRLFAAVVGNVAVGMLIANIVMLVLACLAFYETVRIIVPERSSCSYILAGACYAFSPFLLGMAGYFSTDWFCVCTVTILTYYIVSRKWTGTVIWACVFVLSKEPALVAYGGICLGMVIADLTAKGQFKEKFIGLFKTAHYYYMLIPVFIWFGTYKILGQWSAGSGGFGLDMTYIINKFKVFFVLNFNWAVTALAIVGIIYILIKKMYSEHRQWLMPAVMGNLLLLVFNIMFKTANHPRYIDSFVSVNLLLGVVGVMLLLKGKAGTIALGIASLLFLISCYVTVDPISLTAFDSVNTGSAKLLVIGNLPGGDSSIYNKQMLWFDKPINEAFADAIKDGSRILIPACDNSIYCADGMSEYVFIYEDFCEETQYWDSVSCRRVPYNSEDVGTAEKISVIYADGDAVISADTCGDSDISVIYIKGMNDYRLSENVIVSDTCEYKYRGITVTRDIIQSK